MARVTHVKSAQQRYRTVPVLDEDGKPKRTPVIGRNGQQKVSKRGPVFMSVTQADKSQPLPNLRCDYPGCQIDGGEILPGTSYKHITPKSGPYGGHQRNRHEAHPSWQVWEYSSSLSARLAQVSYDFWNEIDNVESPDDASSALNSAAEAVREIAQEKEDGADNIESGFGHETSSSQELREVAEQLESWADEIEQVDVPELPEPEETDCPECNGTGNLDGEDGAEVECEECSGSGLVTPEEPTDEQIEEWREELRANLTIVDESPV